MMAMNANHTECYGYMYMYRSIGQASKVPARTDKYQKFFRRKYKSYTSFKLVNAINFDLTLIQLIRVKLRINLMIILNIRIGL